MTKFTPPVVVRGSRMEAMVEAKCLRFLRVEKVELEIGVRGGAESEDASLRRVHAEIIAGVMFADRSCSARYAKNNGRRDGWMES